MSEAQIGQIVEAIRTGLDLQRDDRVLDVACGNGALSRYFFDDCAALYGVDFSDYLIEVAQRNFARPPRFEFSVGDAAGYVLGEPQPERFDKVLCYGSFSFFSAADAETVLRELARRFVNVRRVYLGNLPDRDRAERFYPNGAVPEADLDDPAAAIGIWRGAAQWRELASAHGWQIRFHHMPADFYAAHYRFDVILDRSPR